MSREDQVFLAKLAEQAERYEEMVEAMKKVAELVRNICETRETSFKWAFEPYRVCS